VVKKDKAEETVVAVDMVETKVLIDQEERVVIEGASKENLAVMETRRIMALEAIKATGIVVIEAILKVMIGGVDTVAMGIEIIIDHNIYIKTAKIMRVRNFKIFYGLSKANFETKWVFHEKGAMPPRLILELFYYLNTFFSATLKVLI